MKNYRQNKMGGGIMKPMYSKGNLVGKQVNIAKAAPPKNKITGADFKALKKRKA
jgi:hypothetical protein|tara:strand:+ start:46 stop:207 length:162 start_codon:yes stop_codon:yes gene_type:complete